MTYYSRIAEQKNNLSICIDRYKKFNMQGRAYHSGNRKPVLFRELQAVLIAFDHFMNENGTLQASTEWRSFYKGKERRNEEKRKKKKETLFLKNQQSKDVIGEKATFLVQVQYRQNATWQGDVVWIEKNEKKKFRSALELIMLMNSALDEEDEDDVVSG